MAGKHNYVRDANGVEVHGLTATTAKKTGITRYYTDLLGKDKRHWFKGHDDEQQAIFLHRQWMAKLTHSKVHFKDKLDRNIIREFMSRTPGINILHPPVPDGTITHSVPESVVFKQLREMILQDPQEAANRLGIPQLAHLEQLDPPTPSMTLDAALELYLRKTLGDKTRYRARSAWAEFVTITGAKDMASISKQDVIRWGGSVTKDSAPATIKGRVIQVRTICKHAATYGDDDQQCERVRALLKKIVLPKTAAPNPQPITRDDFHALLDKTDDKWKTILLMALNAAFYPIDIRFVPWSAITEGMVIYERTKTPGVPRVALLWDRTIEALDRCREDSETVFISSLGRPYGSVSFWQAYCHIAKAAGVTSTFSSIRDGALTWALRLGGNTPAVTVLAGHKLPGLLDPYTLRDPGFVRPATEAIERHYFG